LDELVVSRSLGLFGHVKYKRSLHAIAGAEAADGVAQLNVIDALLAADFFDVLDLDGATYAAALLSLGPICAVLSLHLALANGTLLAQLGPATDLARFLVVLALA
jgi:hypothetical protein